MLISIARRYPIYAEAAGYRASGDAGEVEFDAPLVVAPAAPLLAPSELALMLLLERVGGAVSAGRIFLPPDTTRETFTSLLRAATLGYADSIGQVRQYQFYIADILRQEFVVYGDTYTDAIEITGLSQGTLRNWVSVSGILSAPGDRRSDLGFEHHVQVAVKDLDSVKRRVILSQAAEDRLTVKQTRALVQTYRPEPLTPRRATGAPVTPAMALPGDPAPLPTYNIRATVKQLMGVAKLMSNDDIRELGIQCEALWQKLTESNQ